MDSKQKALRAKLMQQIVEENRPWFPVEITHAPQAAIKALDSGTADPYQQRVALNYIKYVLGMQKQGSYAPDSERDSAFAEGRRWVASQIDRFLELPLVAAEPTTERENKYDRR